MDRLKADSNEGKREDLTCDECGGQGARDENDIVVCEDCSLVLDETPSMEPSWDRVRSARKDDYRTRIDDV